MKRTTKYINQFRQPNSAQKTLFDTDEQQIKEFHLRKLKALRNEADERSKEWIRKQRLTMLGERK